MKKLFYIMIDNCTFRLPASNSDTPYIGIRNAGIQNNNEFELNDCLFEVVK